MCLHAESIYLHAEGTICSGMDMFDAYTVHIAVSRKRTLCHGALFPKEDIL